MLELEYNLEPREFARATADFLNSRPTVKILFLSIKISCLAIMFGFSLKLSAGTWNGIDALVASLALSWFFGWKSLYCFFLERMLRYKKVDGNMHKCQINKDKLWYQMQGKYTFQQTWHELKHVYKNMYGYIIPMTGLSNSGQFVWLPNSTFKNAVDENQFLTWAQDKQLKVKTLR